MSAVVALAMGQATTDRPGGTAGATANTAGHGETRRIDGQWEVVYVEMDGKKIENKNFANVTIQGNKLTCRHDGKEKTWMLEFGPHHQVRAEETTADSTTSSTGGNTGTTGNNTGNKTGSSGTSGTSTASGSSDRHSHGVYIAGNEYLCFSMNHGRDTTGGTGRPAGASSSQTGGNQTGTNQTGTQTGGNRTGGTQTGGNRAGDNQTTTGSPGHGIYGSHFVLILHRSGSGGAATTNRQ